MPNIDITDAMNRRTQDGRVLVLRTCEVDMTSRNGFVWPESGAVEAPDWDPTPKCGGGLHGLPWGVGMGDLLGPLYLKWLVVAVDPQDIVVIDDAKVKFPRGEVVFVGERSNAISYLLSHGASGLPVCFATASVGDYGTALVGYCGTATAGDYGTAVAGYHGTATVGDDGIAKAGACGTAIAGYRGIATAGHNGRATAGERGVAKTGHIGTATVGDYGTAIVGDSGTAVAGAYGTAKAGRLGSASAGVGGSLWFLDGREYTFPVNGRDVLPNVMYAMPSPGALKKRGRILDADSTPTEVR